MSAILGNVNIMDLSIIQKFPISTIRLQFLLHFSWHLSFHFWAKGTRETLLALQPKAVILNLGYTPKEL